MNSRKKINSPPKISYFFVLLGLGDLLFWGYKTYPPIGFLFFISIFLLLFKFILQEVFSRNIPFFLMFFPVAILVVFFGSQQLIYNVTLVLFIFLLTLFGTFGLYKILRQKSFKKVNATVIKNEPRLIFDPEREMLSLPLREKYCEQLNQEICPKKLLRLVLKHIDELWAEDLVEDKLHVQVEKEGECWLLLGKRLRKSSEKNWQDALGVLGGFNSFYGVRKSGQTLVVYSLLKIAYAPNVWFSYIVEGETYKIPLYKEPGVRFMLSNRINTIEEAQQECEKYPLDSTQTVWYDPKLPTVAVKELYFQWIFLFYLFSGLFSLVLLLYLNAWSFSYLTATLSSLFLLHFIIVDFSNIHLNSGQTTKLTKISPEETDAPATSFPKPFIKEHEESLLTLGFSHLVDLSTKEFERFRQKDYEAFFVSSDQNTVAIVGAVWGTKKILGLFPAPLNVIKGIYFRSKLSNGIHLQTRYSKFYDKIGPSLEDPSTDPAGITKNTVSPEFSLEEMYRSHQECLQKLLEQHQCKAIPFKEKDSCVALLQRDNREMASYFLGDGAIERYEKLHFL